MHKNSSYFKGLERDLEGWVGVEIEGNIMKDNEFFRGDNKKLVSSIEALLSLDAKGALAPHGIGSHARTLLSAAMARLTADPVPIACCTCGNPTDCGKMICEACCYEPLPVPPAGSVRPVPIDDTGYGMVMPPAGGEPELLIAFSDYAKQFTLNSHPATPGMFPVGFPWFKAGFEVGCTRLQAEVEQERQQHRIHAAQLITQRGQLREDRDALQSELTKARELVDELKPDAERWRFFSAVANELQAFPHSRGKMTPEKMNFMCDEAMGESSHSAPADKACTHRFMSLADDPRRCADCDAVEPHDKPVVRLELVRSGVSEGLHIRVWENLGNLWPGVHELYLGPTDNGLDDCAHSEANKHGCPECGEEFKRAPALIETLRANGDRIAMEAVIAQQAQRIADLESGKGRGEPVAEIVSKFGDPEAFGERELIALKDISKFPYGTKLYAEQPAPVAVVMPAKREMRPFQTVDLGSINYIAGWNACRDEVGRLNPSQQETTSFDQGAALESLSKQIYESWQTQPGFVPWVNGGNSLKQGEARQIASRTFELALANQVE